MRLVGLICLFGSMLCLSFVLACSGLNSVSTEGSPCTRFGDCTLPTRCMAGVCRAVTDADMDAADADADVDTSDAEDSSLDGDANDGDTSLEVGDSSVDSTDALSDSDTADSEDAE